MCLTTCSTSHPRCLPTNKPRPPLDRRCLPQSNDAARSLHVFAVSVDNVQRPERGCGWKKLGAQGAACLAALCAHQKCGTTAVLFKAIEHANATGGSTGGAMPMDRMVSEVKAKANVLKATLAAAGADAGRSRKRLRGPQLLDTKAGVLQAF
jgi:hypothetical protein